jgi:hypothetical protein
MTTKTSSTGESVPLMSEHEDNACDDDIKSQLIDDERTWLSRH